MQKTKLTLGFCLLILCSTYVNAQNTLYLNLKNNSQKQYTLASVQKLTFSSGNLNVNKTNGSTDTLAINTIGYLSFQQSIITGIFESENSFTNSAQIYPNPLIGEVLTISYQINQAGTVQLEVLNLNGTVLWQQKQYNQAGSHTTFFQNQNLPTGLYICRVIMGNNVEVKQLIINN